jgi:hypothetical protein
MALLQRQTRQADVEGRIPFTLGIEITCHHGSAERDALVPAVCGDLNRLKPAFTDLPGVGPALALGSPLAGGAGRGESHPSPLMRGNGLCRRPGFGPQGAPGGGIPLEVSTWT